MVCLCRVCVYVCKTGKRKGEQKKERRGSNREIEESKSEEHREMGNKDRTKAGERRWAAFKCE